MSNTELPSILYVELRATTEDELPIFENPEKEQFLLPLNQAVSIGNPITPGEPFEITTGAPSVPEIILELDDEGNVQIGGACRWIQVSSGSSEFQYLGVSNSLELKIWLRGTNMNDVEIILVGTVPTP